MKSIRINNVNDLLKEEEMEYQRKESEFASIEGQNAKLEEEVSLLGLERDEIGEEIRGFSTRKEELESRLKEIEEREENTQGVIIASQDLMKGRAKEREEIIVLSAKINTEIQSLS